MVETKGENNAVFLAQASDLGFADEDSVAWEMLLQRMTINESTIVSTAFDDDWISAFAPMQDLQLCGTDSSSCSDRHREFSQNSILILMQLAMLCPHIRISIKIITFDVAILPFPNRCQELNLSQ